MTGIPDVSVCPGFSYIQIIEEELQLSLTTYEECFTWLNDSLQACKASFAKPDIELLPQTPHAKRCRPKRVLKKRYSEKSQTASSSVESDKESPPAKNTKQTRSRRTKQSSTHERVTRSTRSRLNFNNSNTSSQSSSLDVNHTPVSKPVYHVVFSPPAESPLSPSSIVKLRTSAYEAMLEKKNSSSPIKLVRKLVTNETPENHSITNTQETLKSNKVISVISPSPRNDRSMIETYENHSREVTPKNMTPSKSFKMITPLTCIENRTSFSRKSLKTMTKQLKRLSGINISRKESRDTLMEVVKDQVEPTQCEETVKRPRTRLRLKKKTVTTSESSYNEESVAISSGSTSNPEIHTAVHSTSDDKENSVANSEKQSPAHTERIKLCAPPEPSDLSDSDREVFRVPRTKTRVKRAKKVKNSESDLPRTSCSDSDTSTERPLRKNTRTKPRKAKTRKSKASENCVSVCSDTENVFEKSDSQRVSCSVDIKEDDVERASTDSGIMSARLSATNLDLSSKGMNQVNVDNTIEEENVSIPAQSTDISTCVNTVLCETLSPCVNTVLSEQQAITEVDQAPSSRSKTRKRQAEEAIKHATPKRSCTGSMTNFSRDEQIDHRQTFDHNNSLELVGSDSGNSDGDSLNEMVPFPECPKEKVVQTPLYHSFMNQMKGTPKPSNLLSGVTSFIKRTIGTPTQVSQQIQMEMRKKEFIEKQKRESDRIKKRKETLKQKMEERKRKREERMRRVAELREMKAKQEKEMKEQNVKKIVERLQTTDKLKEEKLREEKEMKARIRLKKQQEAEVRRKLDAEERLQKRLEMEEDFKRHEELMQRKKEFEDQERQKKIAEERKKYERMAELEKEKVADLEKQRKGIDEVNRERQKYREEREKANARERAEKEKQELERRRERDIALKKDLDKLHEMERRRIQIQQQEEQKKEEQRRQEQKMKAMIEKHNNDVISKGAMPAALIHVNPASNLNSTITLDSSTSSSKTDLSLLTSSKYNFFENYNISDINSDDSTDDDEAPKKKIPAWAQDHMLKPALIQQHYNPPNLDILFGKVEPPNLSDIFVKQKPRFNRRGSTGIWNSPLVK